MSYYNPKDIAEVSIEKDVEKANTSHLNIAILGFLGGAFIAFGYLAYIRVVGSMLQEWEGLAILLGASVFPIGLVLFL